MPRSGRDAAALAVAGGLSALMAGPAGAGGLDPIQARPAPVQASGLALHLEVAIRGASTHLIEPFTLLPDGRLLARRADLEEVGIRVSGDGDPRAPIDLDTLPRVAHRYDAARQVIDFALSDADRLARVYDARPDGREARPPRTDWGAVLNYRVYGTTADGLRSFPRFQGLNATLEARAFGPYGTLGQTLIAGSTVGTGRDGLRLDTTYGYSDVDRMATVEVGDAIAGGLPWTRPFRFGGVQVRRDFGTREDLVTQPLPNLSGSAAVPSTVDVFVDGVKAFSQNVAAGPYSISNLPVVSGNGTAHVVVTDASGQQTETAMPFFATPALLAPGLTDFALGGGFARRGYGLVSDDYGTRPLGTATARRGLTDWLTLEGHAEGGAGLEQAGVGAAGRVGPFGTLSGALSGSRRGGAGGAQVYLGYSVDVLGASLSAASQHTLSRYADIGSVTADGARAVDAGAAAARYASGVYTLDARPARALDRFTVGVPLVVDPASLSVSLVHLVEASGARSRIVSASLVRPLPCAASVFATAYVDASRRDSAGLFVGLSIPLGGRLRADVGGTSTSAGRHSDVAVGQPLEATEGSVGWRLRDVEGGAAVRGGSASYRSGYGTVAADVSQDGREFSGRGALDGSVGYVAGAGFFAGNHASDGFAVVDAGAPGVPVLQDNRVVGVTDPWGKLLVSNLRPYGTNGIAIDPAALPPGAEAAATHETVVPTAHGGVGLSFGVDRAVDAALVTFVLADGRPVQAGSRGRAEPGGEPFVVGYDGQAYVRHLGRDNAVQIDLGDVDCRADFAYRPDGGNRVRVGPVPCR